MFPQQQHHDNLSNFPEAPRNTFASASSMNMEMHAMHMEMDVTVTYPSITSMGFEPSLYPENSSYVLSGHASPSVYAEDIDMRLPSSGLSATSIPSASSSVTGSPHSYHDQIGSSDWNSGRSKRNNNTTSLHPSIVGNDCMHGPECPHNYSMEDYNSFEFSAQPKNFVDPTLIHPEVAPPMPVSPYDAHFHHPVTAHAYAPSPSLSSSPQPILAHTDSNSPYFHSCSGSFAPVYTTGPYGASMDPRGRRLSMAKFISPGGGSTEFCGEDVKEKQRCTYPDCGKIYKDLKAHMLTHQNERPEKCPIQTCEYHIKGFARKYDKNRHTLTHYKGTMVCGFCPGSGSPAEKSFNRADVFKRHLTAVHGVEQTPPNGRKKISTGGAATAKKLTGYAPDATGKCSTCSSTFSNAQDFYEHLDECVLRIVQQEDPIEAINAQRLAEVENDKVVQQTLEKNFLPTTTKMMQSPPAFNDENDVDLAEDDQEDYPSSCRANHPLSKKTATASLLNGSQKSRGLTHSRGGVPMAIKARGRKNRRDYPSSWGFDKDQMTMRKRIMAVFDGPRRLAKDDMMLSTDHEVRIKLADGKSYVTDLDVQTLKRAEGFHRATDEEKGPWISDDPTKEQLKEMQDMLKTDATASI
ncbi:hypothetical protein E4U14_007300 [Claviceps sp. LM454 group G7]|nr:hypothetical protein E4U14_007300 [Claviceps sp. LM454 group G7]